MNWISKPATTMIFAAMLMLAAAVLGYGTMSTIKGMIDNAAKLARSERDAHWQGEIARANEMAAQNIIAQMKISSRLEADARATIDTMKTKLSELEEANAALPDNDACGLDRDRTRLLNDKTGANREN